MKLKVLDLFSGIGGFSLGLERAGFETVAFCEIEKYPQEVLKKHWPNIPRYEDVRNVTKERLEADGIIPNVICGGFPCQDLSTAGRQAGIDGEKSGLWKEYKRIISELRPDFAIVENVTNLLNGERGSWFGRFLGDLAEIGYDAIWHSIPASELGAHHHRDRVWIVAYPNTSLVEGRRLSSRIQQEIANFNSRSCDGDACEILADTTCKRQQRQGESFKCINTEKIKDREAVESINGCIKEIWKTEPELGRVVDGVSSKSHRHRLAVLGNAVIPQIPEMIDRAIMEHENETT